MQNIFLTPAHIAEVKTAFQALSEKSGESFQLEEYEDMLWLKTEETEIGVQLFLMPNGLWIAHAETACAIYTSSSVEEIAKLAWEELSNL
jgi:hypothetical protein